MTVPVSPSGVPQQGLSGKVVLLGFALLVGAVVGIAALGRVGGGAGPAITRPPTALGPTPFSASSPSPIPTRRPTPAVAAVSCPAPAIAPLTSLPARHPADLVPTGIETVSATSGGESQLVVDRDGSLWAFGAGRLSRIDPATGRRTSWTIADDAAFAAPRIARAAGGGVWLTGARAIRWFDGVRFRDVIPTPVDTWDVLEAADGSLWASSWGSGLLHWDGRSWSGLGRCSSGGSAGLLALDPSGRLVVAFADRPNSIARYDGATYWTFTGPFGSSRGEPLSLAVTPDGAVWVGGDSGVARFDGATWESFASAEFSGTSALAVDPGGTVYAALGYPDGPSASRLARWDGRGWVGVGWAEAALADAPPRFAALAFAPDGTLYAATSEGIGQYRDGAWRLVTTRDGPLWPSDIVALGRDEAWAGDDRGLWHLRDGSWTLVELPGTRMDRWVADLDISGDGTLWVATAERVVALVDGEAVEVPFPPLTAPRLLAGAAGRSAWVVGGEGEVSLVRITGRKPTVTAVERPPLGAVQRLAVAPDGTLWAAGDGGGPGGGGVARFDGHAWTIEHPLGAVAVGASTVAVAPDGTVWAGLLPDAPGPGGPIVRFDGRRWTSPGPDDADGMWVNGFAFGRDGSVWVAGDRLFRFDGRAWSSSPGDIWFGLPTIAPDETVFVVGPSGIQRFTGWPFD